MTLGDVLAVIAGVLGTGAALTGVLLAMAIWFPRVTQRAQERVQERPWRCWGIGVALSLTLGLLSVTLMNAPNGATKLLGWILFVAVCSLILIGAAGVARLMGERICNMAKPLTPFAGLLRGSIILSIALFFPVIGWFFLAPMVGLCALGAGAGALRRQREVQVQPSDESMSSVISFDMEETEVIR